MKGKIIAEVNKKKLLKKKKIEDQSCIITQLYFHYLSHLFCLYLYSSLRLTFHVCDPWLMLLSPVSVSPH